MTWIFCAVYTACNACGPNLPDDSCRHVNTGPASLPSMLKMSTIVCEYGTALQEVT